MEVLIPIILAAIPWTEIVSFILGVLLRQPKMAEKAQAKIVAKVKKVFKANP